MNVYDYVGHSGSVFVGMEVSPTTFVVRDGEQLERPFGSPVECAPGDQVWTHETVDHPLLRLTDQHPYAPRPRVPRPSTEGETPTDTEEQ